MRCVDFVVIVIVILSPVKILVHFSGDVDIKIGNEYAFAIIKTLEYHFVYIEKINILYI